MDLEIKFGDLKIEVPTLYKDVIGANYTTINELFAIIDDLKGDINHLQEEFDDYKEDVRDNYKPISYAEQIGYNECDFYEER